MSLVQLVDDDSAATESFENFISILQHLHEAGPSVVKLNSFNDDIIRTVSTSCQLFQCVQTECCLLKLLVTFLRQSVAMFKDGGLFTALLTANLIVKTKHEGFPVSSISHSFHYVQHVVAKYIERERIEVNLGRYEDIRNIVKTILASKLTLSKDEINYLCLLYVKMFTQMVAMVTSSECILNNVIIYEHEGVRVVDTTCYHGYLLRLPPSSDMIVCNDRTYRCVVVDIALSFDSEEMINKTKVKVNIKSKAVFRKSILKTLKKFCFDLLKHADILICQKVVHPLCKQIFRSANVLCIDRVGLHAVAVLENNYGCKCISHVVVPAQMDGHMKELTNLQVVHTSGKHYLLLPNTTFKSLIISGRNEHEVGLIKHCFETSILSLQSLTKHPYGVFASGCMATKLCVYLANTNLTADIVEEMNSSVGMAYNILRVFISSFADIIKSTDGCYEHYVDTRLHHHWINAPLSSTCCCGYMTNTGNLKFVNIKEFLYLQSAIPPIVLNIGTANDALDNTAVNDVTTTFNVLSASVYEHNINSTFEIAAAVLKVGTQIIQK